MKLKILLSVFLSLILSVNVVTAQKKTKKIVVTGYVVDAGNNAVADANIRIDNKKTSSHTDKNGFYKVKVNPDADLIAVYAKTNQFIEKSIKGQTTINFSFPDTIVSDITAGDSNESINTGYTKINPNKTAVAVSKSDVMDVPDNAPSIYNNIYDMIQSKVPGVEVQGNKILIRGMNRMGVGNVDNSPVFVVDGMPVNTIDYIIPENVKSITFLKGTSAAIYGSQGVNGVIVIKLKKAPKAVN